MAKFMDLRGRRYGRLVVKAGPYPEGRYKYWLCRCDCLRLVRIEGGSLRSGDTRSCGCLRKDLLTRHGGAGRRSGQRFSRLYQIWANMIQRCQNPNNLGFKNYGGRGIKVCEDWKDFSVFQDWARASGYQEDLSIERIDNDGNYEPGNCRWATFTEQMRNGQRSVMVTAWGETKNLADWVDDPRCSLPYRVVYARLQLLGWTPEDAVGLPLDSKPVLAHSKREKYLAAWGETKSMQGWADDPRCTVDYGALAARLSHGWPVEAAISAPKGSRRPR